MKRTLAMSTGGVGGSGGGAGPHKGGEDDAAARFSKQPPSPATSAAAAAAGQASAGMPPRQLEPPSEATADATAANAGGCAASRCGNGRKACAVPSVARTSAFLLRSSVFASQTPTTSTPCHIAPLAAGCAQRMHTSSVFAGPLPADTAAPCDATARPAACRGAGMTTGA